MRAIVICWLALGIAVAWAADPFIVAHRGGMAERPENTFAAFDNAVKLGVRMIEFDLGVTADDVLVVHHDSSVNPHICQSATAKPGPIRTLTLKQILTFDCGSRQAERFPRQKTEPGAKMPTFSEMLERYGSQKVLMLVETKMVEDGKPGFVDPEHFAKLIAAQIRKHRMQGRVILQSGDYRTLSAMKRLEPAVEICLLNARRFKPDYLALWEKYRPEYFMLRHDDVSDEQLMALRAKGVRVISSTANTEQDWKQYRSRAFDAILTDEPSAVQRFLSKP